jgi:hypothetical protein
VDDKAMFAIVDEISGNKSSSVNVLPEIEMSKLPEVFAEFFHDKIAKIRSSLVSSSVAYSEVALTSTSFSSFNLMSPDEVSKVIHSMKNKSCSLDPMPTSFVKQCMDVLSPVLTDIVNSSFISGVFPENCKMAVIKPLIKKSDLDRNILKNY